MPKQKPDSPKTLFHRLERCESCGTFRGEALLAGKDQPVRIVCSCSNGRCPRCRRPLVATPFMRTYDDVKGHEWHAPAFSASCAMCGPLFMAHFSDFTLGDNR